MAKWTPESKYSPEVEARRADYEALAKALLTMIDLETEHVQPRLDVPCHTREGQDHVLTHAIEKHLFLAFENVNWYSPEAMALYVEMRLLADEQRAKPQKGEEADG